MRTVSKEQAKMLGFPVYNGGAHHIHTVEADDETISLILRRDGQDIPVTIAVINGECIDMKRHDVEKTKFIAFNGGGPTVARGECQKLTMITRTEK